MCSDQLQESNPSECYPRIRFRYPQQFLNTDAAAIERVAEDSNGLGKAIEYSMASRFLPSLVFPCPALSPSLVPAPPNAYIDHQRFSEPPQFVHMYSEEGIRRSLRQALGGLQIASEVPALPQRYAFRWFQTPGPR